MVIKYPVYITGNLERGTLKTVLLKENFDVRDGNWEVSITSCAMRNLGPLVPKKVVGIRCSLFNSYVQDYMRRKEWNPTVLGVDVVELVESRDSMQNYRGFCNGSFSFNQAEENMTLEISFVDLSDKSVVKANVEVYLTLIFKKVLGADS
jgi:hypothetical protein